MSSSQWLSIIAPWLLLAGVVALVAANRQRLSWQINTYLITTFSILALAVTLFVPNMVVDRNFPSILFVTGAYLLGLFGVAVLVGIVEFGLMPIIGQFQLGAIARVTYYEALLQPFTMIVLFTGVVAISVIARLPFFTYDEDFKMYRDVAASFVFLFTLPVMIFASTKVIDEEIENRTMLTLMSKPVARWQVILGKYTGVLALILVAVTAMGLMAGVCQYMRYYDDQQVDYKITPPMILAPGMEKTLVPNPEYTVLEMVNTKAFYALLPSMALAFMQLATLAAISVAVSTRWGLAANVTVVVLIYVGASMAQFFQGTQDLPQPFAFFAVLFSYVLPGLSLLDLNQRLVFGQYVLGKNDVTITDSVLDLPTYGQVWQYVGMCEVYSAFYIAAGLSLGMALFRSRELS